MALERPGSLHPGIEDAVQLILDGLLEVHGQLHPPRAEQLDAVVAERIVRRRDDDGGQVSLDGQPRQRRSGQDAHVDDVSALAGQSRTQGGLQHGPGLPCVSTDQECGGSDGPRDGASQSHDQLGRELGVGAASYSIGAEPGSGHQTYRFEYCGALRAFLRPYFLDSFSRESRVRNPAFFSAPRSSGSSSHRARAIPRRKAPA